MRAIRLDFAPRSASRAIAAMGAVRWLLVATGLAMGVAGIYGMQSLARQQEAQQAAQDNLRARAAVQPAYPLPAISAPQAQAVNAAIGQLNLPWSRLLAAVEQATPATVALLELAPDAKKHLVKGVAEAASSDVMFAYLAALKRQPFLGNVVLTSHEVDGQDPSRPLRFEFAAEWAEAAQ